MTSLLYYMTAALSFAAVAQSAQSCSRGSQCPQDSPCCSQYGQCGTGAYCLGGCDPFSSFSLDSCMPAPVCKSHDLKLTSTDDIVPNTEYLGNASTGNWVSSGSPQKYTDSDGDQILLTMPKGSVGTLLASTQYVWYGKISAKMKTSRTAGVVSAFILLGDSKDEIDFEFVGTDLMTAQSNFYFQGQPNYDNGKNLSVSSNTFDNYHEYTIDWTPDQVVWSIDGKELRTLKRSDTWNSTDNTWHFPQSPSRIQLSLWPAGSPSNAKGTVDWAGGLINWDSPDVKNTGYFYAMVQEINVQCYDPPQGANITSQNQVSYVYNNDAGTNNTVAITDKGTVMQSFKDSGLNPDANKPQSDSPQSTSGPADGTVPGMEGGGVRGGDGGSSGGSGSSNGGGSSGGSGSGSGGSGNSGGSGKPMPTIHGFSQGRISGASGTRYGGERALSGSLLAVLVAIAGVMLM